MKTITLVNNKLILAFGFLLITIIGHAQTSDPYTTPGTQSFVVPAGVTNVTVQVWGGGGKGGTRSSTYVTGGGGGGAYARKANIAVVPGATYTVNVGAGSTDNAINGGDSWFLSTSTVMAKGGNSAALNSVAGANGGTASGSVGDAFFVFGGGKGDDGNPNNTNGNSGGGGSSAGTAAVGTNASTITGANAPTGGGDGGNGKGSSNGDGQAGDNPGGGGGGAFRQSGGVAYGGNGGNGKVIITYTCPTYTFNAPATAISPTCSGSGTEVTLSSLGLIAGTYTVTYNLSGATSATGNTATMTFGLLGTGTFTTSPLSVGSTNIRITNIASEGCSNAITTNNTTTVNTVVAPTATAGTAITTCATSGAVAITTGSGATNYSTVTWTSNGTGTFTNANSLTTATYDPSAADKIAGSVTLTLAATGNMLCGDATSNKILTITPSPTPVAGTDITTCPTSPAVNITAGSSATSYASVLWTSSGTGTFTNATSLTTATYNPSAADKIAGSVTLTLTATAIAPCTGSVASTKTLTIIPNPTSVAGTAVFTCSASGAVNITAGSSALNNTSVTWTSSGTGTFANANSLTAATYNPSAADKTAGSVTLTLTAHNPGCTNGTSTKILTISATATAVAGSTISTCSNSGAIGITAGSSATNYSAVTWSSSGTGIFTNANSLTTATYTPSPADIIAGTVTLSLTATGNVPCINAVATKTLTINTPPVANVGTAVSTCSTSGAVNITTGSTATDYTAILWTSSGTGTFANATSLTNATYTPSAADKTAGSVLITLTASNPGCGSDSSTKTLTIYTTPTITGTIPATRTGPGTLILGATASVGTLHWYAASTGGASLGFGTSFTTPSISVTTTYYVESVNGTCSSTPRTPVVATVLYPEMDVRGNAVSIVDGDTTPVAADWTDFGATNLTRTFTVYNTGIGVLSLGAITVSGTNASEFTVTTLPSSTVASGSSTIFIVTFDPTAAGIRTAAISIANNDVDENPYNFDIQGTGVNREIDIQGNATTITDGDTTPVLTDWTDFSTVTATRTFTIRNTGNIVLTLGAITFTGANASDFTMTTPPSATIAAYGTTTFVVTFTPSAINNRTATINIANNDSDENPYDFAIQGFGIIPEIDIQGNATSIADGDTTPATGDWTDFGTGTVTRTFTIINAGNTVLNLGAISFTGTNASEFSVTTPPSPTVAAFSTTTFVVTFAPTAIGNRTANFSIVTNDSNENPYDFAIQGTGVTQEIEILGNATAIADGDTTPTTADWTDFSNVTLTRTFIVRNTGNLPLTLGAVTFAGTNPGDFSMTTPPSVIVSAFGNTTLTVTFTQGGIGTRTATFRIANNDSDENPYDFALQATGGTPEINIKSQYNVTIADGDTTPSSTDQTNFGNVSMDGGTVTINLIIENTGTGAMTIGAASFTGTNAADFAIVSAPASTIAAGASSRFKISFSPTTIGAKTAMFSIVNNDSNENPYNFNLAGLGVQTYKDTDSDGVTDNKDIDDDNDGIIDTKEQNDGLNYPLTGLVQYTFLNETFGSGTTKGLININTPGATCTYCYEDGYGSTCDASATLEDGEYCVNYKITGATAGDPENIHGDLAWYDGLDHTPSDTDGRMAIFNASFAAGTFYETRIDGVIPNVPVSYSFWALNIMRQGNFAGSILPNITVEFVDLSNNLLSSFSTGNLGRCSASSTDNSCSQGTWLQFSTSVNLGNVTSFIIRFKNNSTGGGGNDLAIDDINITQNYIDTDGDGIANIFDLDDENDGISDVEEAGFKTYSSGLSKMDLSSSATWTDTNANGLNDVVDAMIAGGTYLIPDGDGDTVPNYLDLDSDNDSLFDVDEAGIFNGDGDINGDGRGDLADTDRDGILDLYDNNTGFGTTVRAFAQDTDANGTPDYLQLDSNNDGINDIRTGLYGSLDADNNGTIDGTADIDKDGIMDLFDTNTSIIGSPRDLDRKLFLDFDGRNDYGQGAGVLGGLSTATMMAWINLNIGFTSGGTIVGQDKFQLRINSAKKLEVYMNGTTTVYNTALATSRWYHVGVVLGGGSLRLYLNGENVVTASVSTSIAADPSLLTIGRNPIASNLFFKGKIDEVRIFNKNLTISQFQRMVYQEIQNASSQVRGFIVPKNVGALAWANLVRYYRMDAYKDDIIDDLTTASIDAGTGMKIYNHKNIYGQQAPMPFVTERTGSFAVAADSPTNEVRGMDIMDQDWSIVHVKHDITETVNNIDLGMLVDAGVMISATNDNKIQNDWYLLLNGKMDLVGKSQLVQTINSDLDATSAGSLERDQQGHVNKYNYNYWSSPVGTINATTNNNSYTVNGVMRDGTNPANPQNITWVPGYDGAPTVPITISKYWIYKFQNTSPLLANWASVGQNGMLLAGQGYTMKGSGAEGPTQNYVFVGKPNNGTITSPIAANNLNLSGNPYASALDAHAFILSNTASTTGALYFWEHYDTNNSHVLLAYQGGYATKTLVGGIPPISPAGISGLGTSTRIPGRFIPVGQGFFVSGSASGGMITFDNSQRAFVKETNVDSNVMFRQSQNGPQVSTVFNNNDDVYETDTYAKIRLGFNSADNFHRQILLGFMDEHATSGIDVGYDAPHIDNQPNDMYFMNTDNKLIIQGDGYFNKENAYPLGIKTAAAGTIRFVLDGIENFDESQEIYIHDKITETYHDIREEAFQVEVPAGIVNDRFALVFKTDSQLGNEEFIQNNEITAFFTSEDNMINIQNKTLDATVTQVELYTILGQSVSTWDVKNQNQVKIQIPVQTISSGTYIVKVQTSKGDISKKIIIK